MSHYLSKSYKYYQTVLTCTWWSWHRPDQTWNTAECLSRHQILLCSCSYLQVPLRCSTVIQDITTLPLQLTNFEGQSRTPYYHLCVSSKNWRTQSSELLHTRNAINNYWTKEIEWIEWKWSESNHQSREGFVWIHNKRILVKVSIILKFCLKNVAFSKLTFLLQCKF